MISTESLAGHVDEIAGNKFDSHLSIIDIKEKIYFESKFSFLKASLSDWSRSEKSECKESMNVHEYTNKT